ncbi:MAG: hypothetical protein R3E53_03860 [Myxococcota bacterium]
MRRRLRALGRLGIRLRRPWHRLLLDDEGDVDSVYGALKAMGIPVNRAVTTVA